MGNIGRLLNWTNEGQNPPERHKSAANTAWNENKSEARIQKKVNIMEPIGGQISLTASGSP